MANITEVTVANFDAVVLQAGNTPVLVDFWASWCPPCRAIAPILEDIGQELHGKVIIVKLNVEDHPQIANRYGVSSIPTMIIFKAGQQADRLVGYQSRENILARLHTQM